MVIFNKKIATVTNNGLVTSVTKEVSDKCKITYPSGKTKTLSCDVTVIIPSEDIRINNATRLMVRTYESGRDL